MSLLVLWEGWCVFPQEAQDGFVEVFNKPPLTEKEKREEEEVARKKAEDAKGLSGAGKSKWRAVNESEERERNQRVDFGTPGKDSEGMDIDVDGAPMDNATYGEEMDDLDGEPMDDEDLDGVPMEDDDDEDMDGGVMPDAPAEKQTEGKGDRNNKVGDEQKSEVDSSPGPRRKPRMRA